MPFVMLAVGLAFNIFRGGMDGEQRIFGISIPYQWDVFLLSAVLMGGIAFLNTWDLPVYFALLVGAFVIRRVYKAGWSWDRFGDLLKLAIPLGVLSLLLYLPFLLSFQSQAGGIMPNLVYPTRGLYLWVMFGPFLVLFWLFFIWLRRRKVRGEWKWGTILVVGLVSLLYAISILLGYKLTQSQSGQQFILAQGETTFGGLLGSAFLHRLAFGAGLLTLTLVLILGVSFLLTLVKKCEPDTADPSPIPFVLLMVVLGGIMIPDPGPGIRLPAGQFWCKNEHCLQVLLPGLDALVVGRGIYGRGSPAEGLMVDTGLDSSGCCCGSCLPGISLPG